MKIRGKVIAAGHICVDITPVFPQGNRAVHVGDILQPGRLLHMNGVDVHTGGSVANTGLALKILGCNVSLAGKIGDDAFGKMVLEILGQYDAAGDMIVDRDAVTSYSVVLAIPGIDRIFLHDPGANDTFCAEDLDWDKVAEAELFHYGYPPLMRRMYENDGEALAAMLERVQSLGTAVSLDMAAVDPSSEAGHVDWGLVLQRVLPYVDLFVPSVEELCVMLDPARYAAWTDRAAGRDVTEVVTREDLQALSDQVLALGVRVVLIKCGAAGMYYRTAGAEQLGGLCARLRLDPAAWASQEGFQHSYVPDAVLSGTGAGDTSIAAFLTSVMQGASLAEAVQMAAATGACCVAAYDALSGLRPLAELKERIEKGWQQNG